MFHCPFIDPGTQYPGNYRYIYHVTPSVTWWRHQMETFSVLLALCAGNSPGTGEFPAQRSVTRSFDVFFDLRLNKRLSKQPWGWWFEPPSCPLWRHCNGPIGDRWTLLQIFQVMASSKNYVDWQRLHARGYYYGSVLVSWCAKIRHILTAPEDL